MIALVFAVLLAMASTRAMPYRGQHVDLMGVCAANCLVLIFIGATCIMLSTSITEELESGRNFEVSAIMGVITPNFAVGSMIIAVMFVWGVLGIGYFFVPPAPEIKLRSTGNAPTLQLSTGQKNHLVRANQI